VEITINKPDFTGMWSSRVSITNGYPIYYQSEVDWYQILLSVCQSY